MRKKDKIILIIIGILVICFFISSSFSYAKYASNSIWNYYLKSKGFYFSSDKLTSPTNVNNNWDGESTHFKVFNYLNDSLITSYDINYKVTCTIEGEATNYSACKLNGTDSNTFNGILSGNESCSVDGLDKETCESSGYEWQYQKAIKDLYFDIVPTGEQEITGLNVIIDVETTSPFKQELSSKFILNKGKSELGSFSKKYTMFNNSDILTITNSYNEDKCVTLSWNADDIRIDLDDNIVKSYNTDSEGYINEVIFTISGKDSLNLTFYRTDSDNSIDENAFDLAESSECQIT